MATYNDLNIVRVDKSVVYLIDFGTGNSENITDTLSSKSLNNELCAFH